MEVEIICTPKLEESEVSEDDERKESDESELGVVDVIYNEFYLTQFSKVAIVLFLKKHSAMQNHI